MSVSLDAPTVSGPPEDPEKPAESMTSDEADALVGRTLDTRYTLRARLGQGGMGAVYLADQHSMDRPVAVKVIAPALAGDARVAARFLREARLAGRITHPRVVAVYDFGRTAEGLLYLVMEWVAGQSLAELLRQGPLPQDRALELAGQIAEALQAAHTLGIVHRDLKPGNVMVLPDGGVKVVDFGLARSLAGEDESVTRSGTMVGTPAYMPPEVALGQSTDARGDLYALGTVLYELLAGHPPFRGTALAVAMHHAYQPPPPLPSTVPPVVARLVEQLMEKTPAQRPESAAVVSARLAALRSQVTEAARVAPPARVEDTASVEEAVPTPRARWGALGLVAALGVGAWAWGRGGQALDLSGVLGASVAPASVAPGARPRRRVAAPATLAPATAAPVTAAPVAAPPTRPPLPGAFIRSP